jgi:hypothetical protein
MSPLRASARSKLRRNIEGRRANNEKGRHSQAAPNVIPAAEQSQRKWCRMFELLSKFEPGQLIGLTAVVGGLSCGALAIVMGIWLAMRKTELEAGLKRSMLERGMSAAEIRIVMEAGSCSSNEHGDQPAHAKQPAYSEI